MQLSPRILIRDVPHSGALETHLEEKIIKINQFCDQIMHCDVVIEQIQKKKTQGKLYKAKLSITVPGEELNITRAANEDVYLAVRDAFNAASRQLKSDRNIQRRAVKSHPAPLHGEITRLFIEEGFGFIEANGEEYYFSDTHVVHPSFEKLEIGTRVQFIEEISDGGLKAMRISVGKHGDYRD